jgi:hypothetical protein
LCSDQEKSEEVRKRGRKKDGVIDPVRLTDLLRRSWVAVRFRDIPLTRGKVRLEPVFPNNSQFDFMAD